MNGWRKPSKEPMVARLSRDSLLMAAKTFAMFLVLCAPPLLIWPVATLHGATLLSGRAGQPSVSSVGELMNCSADDTRQVGNNMLLLTSDGLSNDVLKESFLDLVRRLPYRDVGVGPNAFNKLNVMVIEDPCFLKKSFWNKDLPEFHQGSVINYRKSGMKTSIDMVRPFLGGQLDGGVCADWKAPESELVGMGFNRSRFHHVSLFDRLAGDGLKRAILRLAATGQAPAHAMAGITANSDSAEGRAFLKLLRKTSVVVVNGGNADFVNYVFHQFAPDLIRPLRRRLADGKMVLVTRSAGTMVASADVGLTYESGPGVLRSMSLSTAAMGLAGSCMVRPHFTEKWYLASMVYSAVKNLTVVFLWNGQALKCVNRECRRVGESHPLPEPHFDSDDPRLTRLTEAFR